MEMIVGGIMLAMQGQVVKPKDMFIHPEIKDEFRIEIKQALKSYALWLIEEGYSQTPEFDRSWAQPLEIYKQNLKKLIEQD